MTPKETTLESLDTAISELKKSVDNVSDADVRKELEKTLRNLVRAREKMNPARPFTAHYVVALPFVLIFMLIGVYYFSKILKRECR
ncbi:MAG: hypothetical protein KKB51_07690 [Candidatus Riflebacteria bacterium]|nr:hypothetical protein [Candidatus Riflebacteria bacterium]